MLAKGFLPVSRKMFDGHDPLWEADEPFDRRSAWIDLCQMARRQKREVVVKGELVRLGRGQLLASERFLASRWRWTRGKVRRFLDLLADPDGLDRIRVDAAHSAAQAGAIVTLVAYESYNPTGAADRPTERPRNEPPADQIEEGKKEEATTATPSAREVENEEPAKLAMWADFDKRFDGLSSFELQKAQGLVRGIIDGDTYTAWETPTGDRVPWTERPRLFRLALDERVAKGGNLFNILRQVVIPREFDPFKQTKSTDARPYKSHGAVVPAIPSASDHEAADLAKLKAERPVEYAAALAEFEATGWWEGNGDQFETSQLRQAIRKLLVAA